MSREDFMRRHGIRRIERHEPTVELPYEWFAVELGDSRQIGTGKTISDALDLAKWVLDRKRVA